ncbi:hypothetical protein Vretimale_13087 [Volvox reticuliferus]|uniref:WSC domain-containing protein n=1 Tax=Volvox reticuliferus TaxID=1737510 RepID=A0A8J4CW82_9CHLO|nr:hypothetical protein Vretifemale_15800 [Volvox reticuliferus]GIM09187.1 hypothetical protein Vretimale_13087 [Volvox reticuliferus]
MSRTFHQSIFILVTVVGAAVSGAGAAGRRSIQGLGSDLPLFPSASDATPSSNSPPIALSPDSLTETEPKSYPNIHLAPLPPPPYIDASFVGCYQDSWNRALPEMYDMSTEMTIDRCRLQAQMSGFPYFGLEGGRECFAGNDILRVLTRERTDNCNMTCTGNASQICGGEWALSVYVTPEPASAPPPPSSSGCFIGCFQDRDDWRVLQDMYDMSDNMTIDLCREIALTQGYIYFGVEAGTQCFGGNDLSRAHINGRSAYCDWRCAGDDSQICGGDWAISIYHTSEQQPSPPPPSPASPPPPSLRKEDMVGCYYDAKENRVLPSLLDASDNMTVANCREDALKRGFRLYGVEAGRECWGGDDLERATSLGPGTICDWPCSGNDCEVCGGDWAIVIYTTGPYGSPLSPSPAPIYSIPPPYSFPSTPPTYLVPPLYAQPPSPPRAVPVFLPESIIPEVAHFDAAAGVTSVPIASPFVETWQDLHAAGRRRNTFVFNGHCTFTPGSLSAPPAILFGGQRCLGFLGNKLSNWDNSATSAFTAVWIGRFKTQPASEQMLLSLSPSWSDWDHGFFWTSKRVFSISLNNNRDGSDWDYRNASIMVPPPSEQWVMQVLSRNSDGAGGMTLSYHQYDQSGGLRTWQFPGWPYKVSPKAIAIGGDVHFNRWQFAGELSVLLLYNRSLTETEVLSLVEGYGLRFGWGMAPGSPPQVQQVPFMPPLYSSIPSSPQPGVDGVFLPASLRPESAYFDAAVGVSDYLDAALDRDVVLLWKDVFVADRPDNLFWFIGVCEPTPKSSGEATAASIRFDGQTCFASVEGNLPNWDVSATSAFTAVWIGRYADDSAGEQTILTLSRTPQDYDRELYWTNQQAFVYSHYTGFGFDASLPAPITTGQWVMQVLSRSPNVDSGDVTMSYYWYGQSGVLSAWQFTADSCEVSSDSLAIGADLRDGNRFFKGDLAIVLLYNRTLVENEIQGLADFYRARFAWPKVGVLL